MLLSDFDYQLPKEFIAQTPAEPRDTAKLLVYNRKTKQIIHSQVSNILEFLPSDTLIIANNSRVRNSRLYLKYLLAEHEGRMAEILLLNTVDSQETNGLSKYECMISGKKPQISQRFNLYSDPLCKNKIETQGVVLEVLLNEQMTTVVVGFDCPFEKMEQLVAEYGNTPLPPYINNHNAPKDRYQTVYSKSIGSAAAPTAGLHFTPELIAKLESSGHTWAEVTLHVGLGTFLPLRKDEIKDNILHSELSLIDSEVAEMINRQRDQRKNILAVGTTSVRTVESHAVNGKVNSGMDSTNIFIYPGYKFQVVSSLLTNFHLPKSSLLMLVAAFLGNSEDGTVQIDEAEMIKTLHFIYQEAIANKYRFFSFGDAMLII